jgi:hypothetical protein
METVAPFLEYLAASDNPRRLTLKQADGVVAVVFPVAPTWLIFLGMIMTALAGLARSVIAIWVVVAMHSTLLQLGPPTPGKSLFLRRFELDALASAAPESIFWWSCAGFQWWKFRRWGRVPRVLTASGDGLTKSWLGWWRMRERTWPVADIGHVELRPIRWNLNWRRTVADLYVYRRKKGRLFFRLSSADPQLPNQIAKELAKVLDRPLR